MSNVQRSPEARLSMKAVTPTSPQEPLPSVAMANESIYSTELSKEERRLLALKSAARDAFSQLQRRREAEMQQEVQEGTTASVVSTFQRLRASSESAYGTNTYTPALVRTSPFTSSRYQPAVKREPGVVVVKREPGVVVIKREPGLPVIKRELGTTPMTRLPDVMAPASRSMTGGVDDLWGLYSSEVHGKTEAAVPALQDVDETCPMPTPTRKRKSLDSSGNLAAHPSDTVPEQSSRAASEAGSNEEKSPVSHFRESQVCAFDMECVSSQEKSPVPQPKVPHESASEIDSSMVRASKARRLNKKTCVGEIDAGCE